MATEKFIPSQSHMASARLIRRVAKIAQALQCAASLSPERDQSLKSRLMTGGAACVQLASHVRRHGGALCAHRPKGPKKATKRKPTPAPDMDSILGQFSDALAFLECAVDAQDDLKGINGPALLVLEYGLAEIHKAYGALDRAVTSL